MSKPPLDITSLNERARSRVLADRVCKFCGETKSGRLFGPTVIHTPSGTSYLVFKHSACTTCRAAQAREDRAYKTTPGLRRIVRALVLRGNSEDEIAKLLRCYVMTLRSHYPQELGREQYCERRQAA